MESVSTIRMVATAANVMMDSLPLPMGYPVVILMSVQKDFVKVEGVKTHLEVLNVFALRYKIYINKF